MPDERLFRRAMHPENSHFASGIAVARSTAPIPPGTSAPRREVRSPYGLPGCIDDAPKPPPLPHTSGVGSTTPTHDPTTDTSGGDMGLICRTASGPRASTLCPSRGPSSRVADVRVCSPASALAGDLPWETPTSLVDFAESAEHEIGRQIRGRNGRPNPRKPARLRVTECKGEIGKTQ